tara:strand:- start:149 stop:1072 length:924 start_codon:yes stop_codon:yes gene_type:complete
MKIGYFADGPWSHEALKNLEKEGFIEIAFIVPRYNTTDNFLKSWAENNKVPFLKQKNVNDPDFLKKIKKFKTDLNVSMSFNQILKKEIINLSPKGFINCHAGALPFYRGRNPLNWVLINGEESFGITVHFIDEGIDTGDIINQKIFSISNNDSYASLLRKSINGCADLLVKTIIDINENSFKKISQKDIDPIGSYFPKRVKGDENITWLQSSKKCFDFVRAISYPGPYARTFIKNKEYAIINSELTNYNTIEKFLPGEIASIEREGNIIKTADGFLFLREMAEVGESDALKQAFCPKFDIGTKFSER